MGKRPAPIKAHNGHRYGYTYNTVAKPECFQKSCEACGISRERSGRRFYCDYWRSSPLPVTTHLRHVSSSAPMGPRAWSRPVEMPISAPRPYWPPSASRVEQFHITEDESTSL